MYKNHSCGRGNCCLSRVMRLLNAGDYPGAAGQLLRRGNAGGKRLPG
ncbi:glycoside hydrolase family protein [Rahnella aceris]